MICFFKIAHYLPKNDSGFITRHLIKRLGEIFQHRDYFTLHPTLFLEAIFLYHDNYEHADVMKKIFKITKQYLIAEYKYHKNISLLIRMTISCFDLFINHYHAYGAHMYLVSNDDVKSAEIYVNKFLKHYKIYPLYIIMHINDFLLQGFQIYYRQYRIEHSLQRTLYEIQAVLGVTKL